MSKKYKLALVIPRYNCESSGGVERYCQHLAEKALKRGHEITVLTTKACDHYSWADHFRQNKELVNGVEVRRFSTDYRDRRRFLIVQEKIESALKSSLKEEKLWIKNSVNSRGLENYIRKHSDNYDFFIFMPYIFGITYNCSLIYPEKSLLIPCLHNEYYAYLEIFKEMFGKVRGVMFNSYPEMWLARKLYDLSEQKSALVGVGIESDYNNSFPEKFENKYDYPFIVFVGRKEAGKNIHMLIDYFKIYKKENTNELKLLLLGSGTDDLQLKAEDKENILELGYVPEEDKLNIISSAVALCQPSLNESFSIVLMEAWLRKTPVLVQAGCPVTRDHCQRSNGGLYFRNYYEFEECLNYFLNNSAKACLLGENGAKYVLKNFNWDTLLDRFENALHNFLN